MAEFESKIFKNVESLQGSSNSAMKCEPAELQAIRNTWIAISTSKTFQQLFKNGSSYANDIENEMKGPTTDNGLHADDNFQKQLGNTVGRFPIKDNEQKDSLEKLKFVGACMNLFRQVMVGGVEKEHDSFREAVEKELKAQLEKAYEGQGVDLTEKIKRGGDVLNEALSGEQTDLCSHIAGGLPPGLILGAYPKVLEENGKEPQLRVVYTLDESYHLSNEEKKKAEIDKKLPSLGKSTFMATDLGKTIGSFKPLYQREDKSWVVELKEPGYFAKGQVTVLSQRHLAGRELEANVKMDGFTTGATKQIKMNLKSQQALSENEATPLTEDWVKAQAEQSTTSLTRASSSSSLLSNSSSDSSTSSSLSSSSDSLGSPVTSMSMSTEEFLAKFGTPQEQASANLELSNTNSSMTPIESSLSQSSLPSSEFDNASIASSQTSPLTQQDEAMSPQDVSSFESKIFKSVESLQGSSKVAMEECEPAELQAIRDTWIAISTSKTFQQLFKNGSSYADEITNEMKGPTTDKEKNHLHADDNFQKQLGNTVGRFPIKDNEQKDSLEKLKFVGACMNLFRQVMVGGVEKERDRFREAVEKELKDHLEKAYEGQNVDLKKKIKRAGNVLNEALSGEQTDLCSHIAGGLPPGLILGAYPKVLEENGKEPQLRAVYTLDKSYHLSNEEKANVDKSYGFRKSTEFMATDLGKTIGSFKPLYQREDKSWVVELKEPGYISKGQVTVLSQRHLAGRELEANVKMDGFTTGETKQIKMNLKSQQALSENEATQRTADWVKAQADRLTSQNPKAAIEAAINYGVVDQKLTPAQIIQQTRSFTSENEANRNNHKPEITPLEFVKKTFANRWNPDKVAENKSNAAADKAKTMRNELNQSQEGNAVSPKTPSDVMPTTIGRKR